MKKYLVADIYKYGGMPSHLYLEQLMAYLHHRPWDKIDYLEFVRNDKTGITADAHRCSCGMNWNKFMQDGHPVRHHSTKVCKMLIFFGVLDPELLAAADLHDTPEDINNDLLIDIKNSYSYRVYITVYRVTKTEGMTDEVHFSLVEQSYDSIIVKLADRLHNLRNMTKNLYSSRDFTKERLQKYIKETIDFIYPLGEKIAFSDYVYAESGQRIHRMIKDAVYVANQVLKIPEKHVRRYQNKRKQPRLFK